MIDPILDELHKTRRRLLADAGGTLEGLATSLQERQRNSGRPDLGTRRTIYRTGDRVQTVDDGKSSTRSPWIGSFVGKITRNSE